MLVEVDVGRNVTRTSVRRDGARSHLIRQTLRPIVEAPVGYYLSVPAATAGGGKTRATIVRDDKGNMVALESEPVAPAKQPTGFALPDEAK